MVIAVAIKEGWSWLQGSNAARSSDQFYAALELAEGGDVAGAEVALEAVETSGSGNYPLLARFREAGLLGREGKTAEAVAAYDELANSDTLPRLRELALVLAANLLVDGGDVAAVEQRVQGLAVPENPLRNAAFEAIGLAQYKAGDLVGALGTFQTIAADPTVNSDVRQRMELYIGQLVSEGAVTNLVQAAAAAAEPAAADPAASPMMEAPAMMDAPAMTDAAPPDPAASPMMEAPAMMDAPPAAEPAPAETPPAAGETTTTGG